MAYSTVDDLARALEPDAINQLAQDDSGTNTADTARLEAFIEEADSEIDAYISRRYTVPLATVPAMIRRFSTVIVKWYLHNRRIWTKDENVKGEYEDVIAKLEAIRDGDMDIPGGNLATSSAGYFGAETQDYTRTTMKGF